MNASTRPPSPIRLLVVDDSIYMQMAMRMIVGACPGIEIVGEATNGRDAVQMALALRPDIITMDVNMPGMDGLEATRVIMEQAPAPIIMLSSLTEKGRNTTLRALELGAVDYVAKSSSAIDVDLSTIVEQVAAKIRFWGSRKQVPSGPLAPMSVPAKTDLLVLVGGTGAPSLVSQILRQAQALPFPVLIVQDMAPSFTGTFIEHLGRTTRQQVVEGRHQGVLSKGSLTLMPGGRRGHVSRDELDDFRLDLLASSSQAGLPSDVLASAAAAARWPLFMMLSGEARPLEGLRPPLTQRLESLVWVQDANSCAVDALPHAARSLGLPFTVGEPQQFAEALANASAAAASNTRHNSQLQGATA